VAGAPGVTNPGFSIYDRTNSANRFYIDSSGRCGIGSTSPDGNLTIGGLTNTGGQSVDAINVNRTDGLRLFGVKWDVTSNEVRFSGNTKNYVFRNGSSEAETARIDSSGRLLVGTSSALTGNRSQYSQVAVVGNSSGSGHGVLSVSSFLTGTGVTNNSEVSQITLGCTNADFAWIQAFADGTPASGSYPGRLTFSTTADGASSPTARVIIDQAGRFKAQGVYDNTTAAAANVWVDTDGSLRRSTSSIKYKTNIETLEDSYADAILQVRPVWYKSLSSADNPAHGWWGFIAEEVAQIDPRLVQWKTSETKPDENGNLVSTELEKPEPEGVAYDRFVPHLLNLIKRQGEAIADLQAEVAALKAQ
jgi:hypothetical protein